MIPCTYVSASSVNIILHTLGALLANSRVLQLSLLMELQKQQWHLVRSGHARVHSPPLNEGVSSFSPTLRLAYCSVCVYSMDSFRGQTHECTLIIQSCSARSSYNQPSIQRATHFPDITCWYVGGTTIPTVFLTLHDLLHSNLFFTTNRNLYCRWRWRNIFSLQIDFLPRTYIFSQIFMKLESLG